MTAATSATLAGLVVLWAVTSNVLARHDITGPVVFVVAGYVLANPSWGVLSVDVDTSLVHHLAEITLGLVLFTDASRVDVGRLRGSSGLPVRLLVIGLPLTIIAGTVGAQVIFGAMGWALALYVGAALAPTDAALSVQIITDKRIPERLRTALNVESGLNDGIATPVVTVALALAATALGLTSESTTTVGHLVAELAIGIGVGAVGGALAGWLIVESRRRGWSTGSARQIATLATAGGIFVGAVAVDGNGFLAAFVAGIVFGHVVGTAPDEELGILPELGGEVLGLVVWFLFGATLIPLALSVIEDGGDLLLLLGYAIASLTVFRMVPVAIALIGSRLSMRDVAIVGWFGPRGLASVVFALLGVEQLAGATSHQAEIALAAVGVTVACSVLAHGLTGGPVAARYPTSVSGPPAAADPTPARQSIRPRMLRLARR